MDFSVDRCLQHNSPENIMADFLGHMHMTVDKWIFSAFQQAILRAFATLEHAISSTDKSTVSVMYAGMQRMMANMMHQVKGQSAQHTVDIESTSSGNQLTPVSENFTDDAPTSSGFESVENITGDASTSSGRELICSGENFIDDASTSSGFESTPLNNILDNGTVFENMPSYEESIYNDGTNRNVPTSSGIDFEAICDDGKSLNAPISSIETTENNYGEPENGTGTNIAESQAHHEYYIQYNIDELVPDTASGSENGAVGGNDDATKPNNKRPDWFEVCTFTNADDYDKYLEEEHFAKCSSTERNKTTSVYLRCNRVKKKGVQCAARLLCRMSKTEKTWVIFSNRKEHTHNDIGNKIQPEIRKKVALYRQKRVPPKKTFDLAKAEFGEDAPTMGQIYNLIRVEDGKEKKSFTVVGDVADWCDKNNKPTNDDEPYVLNFRASGEDFQYVVSTPRLLKTALQFHFMCAVTPLIKPMKTIIP